MLLAINIGNTSIGCGVFNNKELVKTFRMESKGNHNYLKLIQENLKNIIINKIVISSVVPAHNTLFEQICTKLFNIKPLYVYNLINKKIIKVKYPERVGVDILCNVIAGYAFYGGPSLVVDLGTATTFDAIDTNGNFLGSAIAPGMQIAHEALIQQTALLKAVPLIAPKSVIGIDTVSAIQSGVILGYIDLVEGMIKRFKKELGENTKVIATGGLCEVVANHTKVFDVVDKNLTLKGIEALSRQEPE